MGQVDIHPQDWFVTPMASRRKAPINLKAPYLRRLWVDRAKLPEERVYPFSLPFLDGFELAFDRAVTIIVGENGTGKSTLLEAIAALAGYDRAGGGKGYRPNHHHALAADGGDLSAVLRAAWLPKLTNGWFFRAESFFTVARYLDDAARELREVHRRITCRIPTARASSGSSRNAAAGRGCLSSTSRNRRCRRRDRLSS